MGKHSIGKRVTWAFGGLIFAGLALDIVYAWWAQDWTGPAIGGIGACNIAAALAFMPMLFLAATGRLDD